MFCFLEIPVLRFSLLPYYRRFVSVSVLICKHVDNHGLKLKRVRHICKVCRNGGLYFIVCSQEISMLL